MQLKKHEFSTNVAPGSLVFFLNFPYYPFPVPWLFPQLSSVSCAVLLKNNSGSVALLFIKKLIALLTLTQKHSFCSSREIHSTQAEVKGILSCFLTAKPLSFFSIRRVEI